MLALLHQTVGPSGTDASSEDDHQVKHETSSLRVSASAHSPTTPSATVIRPPMLASDPRSPSIKEADRPFQCQEPGCGRRFNRKFTLSEHMKTHTGEKPYVCPVVTCGKRFSTSGNLARHKRLHASIKPFECSIDGCKRSFPNELKLQQHLKIHLGGKTHMCKAPGCGKSFSTAGNLTRHMKNHHHGNVHSHAMLGLHHDSQSPVSVATTQIAGEHPLQSMYAPATHVPLTSYATLHPPAYHTSSSQPSMANLYYSFTHANTHSHDASHHPLHGGASSFPHQSFHPPMYEDMHGVHGFHGGDGPAPSLFDDVIRFELGHPRLI
ncbi:hypothetical protein Poli38472_005681 [Pythium oligandrum]|uniref:C2H2-type domain-containing protein n=1 Tax=Pythium oligandrum TaxID=41045 RepID=A0A8K1CHG7_PYTOL|nr:hypothetical protein Poli38472_005681 [Pythium oligandrum]|eukprot:TMW63063.1 hypothetical protein Poli38472_005681 [Pythium oligandrum]